MKTKLLLFPCLLVAFLSSFSEAQAIAPVLIPIFASVLEIISGILLFITAPTIVLAALVSFFGFKIRKDKAGKLHIGFNFKVFLFHTISLIVYTFLTVAATIFLLHQRLGMQFVVAQKIQPKTLDDLMNGVKVPELTQYSWGEVIGASWVSLFAMAVIISALGLLIHHVIVSRKVPFHMSIFLKDLLWLTLMTFLIMMIAVGVILYFYNPHFLIG